MTPPSSELRIVLALGDDEELMGVAPLFAQRGRAGLLRYRFLGGSTFSRVGPLALPGREGEVASLIALELAEIEPRLHALSFQWVPSTSPWPDLFKQCWLGNGSWALHRQPQTVAPTLRLGPGSFDDWRGSKSKNFRQQMARRARHLHKRGVGFRLISSPEEISEGVRSLASLHHARWDRRGGSSALDSGVEAMLVESGRRLVESGRFRLWLAEVNDVAISAHLFFAAGGNVTYLMGGFDVSWADQQPSLQTLMVAIEHAWRGGDRLVDFGPGGASYKYRFATGEDDLEAVDLIRRGPRYPLTRLQLSGEQLRRVVSKRLPAHAKWLLKRVSRRVRRVDR